MPFLEDMLEKQKAIWGEYHPNQRTRDRSCVMIRDIGCVFIGTVEQCQDYIRDNAYKYEKQNSRELVTV